MSASRIPELMARQPADPPTFLELARQRGFQATADRINRWAANNYDGDWRDPEYDEHFDGGDPR